MERFTFYGEESARFTRFASACLAANLDPILVKIEGREPLTSRPLTIVGELKSALLDGYIRYITVFERDSGMLFNVAGSNATRSVAARRVEFSLSPEAIESLKAWGRANRSYVPRLALMDTPGANEFVACENALTHQTEETVMEIVRLLSADSPEIRTEAALTIRALAKTVNGQPSLQLRVEEALITFCEHETNRDARVAGVEDLGYIGEDRSKVFLGNLCRRVACDQTCWAAAIALGRLSGDEEVFKPLMEMLEHASIWVRSAALLSLSRHAQRDMRDRFEPLFARHLSAPDPLPGEPDLKVYSCLGLSPFDTFEQSTWEKLAAIIGNDSSIGSKGYAALAIASGYQNCPDDIKRKVKDALTAVPSARAENLSSIDSMLGLEFLAELASVGGAPDAAARLYHQLAASFRDWRAKYYTAMRYVELGEAEARTGGVEDALRKFEEALRELKFETKELPEDAVATVEFKRSVIDARARLQALFSNWMEEHTAARLIILRDKLQEIRAAYQTYARGDSLIGGDRQLVERERNYLKRIIDFLDIIDFVLEIDQQSRDVNADDALLQRLRHISNIALEGAERLLDKIGQSFNLQMLTLTTRAAEALRELNDVLLATKLDLPAQLRLVRMKVGALRDVFLRSNWPMPGRACPVYGLGRASIGVRQNGHSGSGTRENPYRIGCKESLPLYVKIAEMATGGGVKLAVEVNVLGQNSEFHVPVVEGEYSISVDLSSCPSDFPCRIEAKAVFRSRDCTQETSKVSYYVIRAVT